MIATKDSSVIAITVEKVGGVVSTAAVSGRLSARENRSTGPSNIQKVTNRPTARKAASLTMRFGRDRQHQAVLMLGRVDMAGAEQDREGGHRERDQKRGVADHVRGELRRHMHEHRAEHRRHRFQLQRDIGNGADDRDQRHQRRHRLLLAVARGDEVGDRGDVLALGEPHDAQQAAACTARSSASARHRSSGSRSPTRGQADRAEKGPGGAIDRQTQRIDQQARAVGATRSRQRRSP